MKQFKTVSIVLIFSSILSCQINYAAPIGRDAQISPVQATDTLIANKVEKLIRKATLLMFTETDSAKMLSNQALKISKQEHFDKGIADALNVLGIVYDIYGDFAKAFSMDKEAFDIYTRIGDERGAVNCQANMAVLLKQEGKFDEALAYSTDCYNYYKKTRDTLNEARILSTIGNLHLAKGDSLSLILKKLEEGEAIATALNNKILTCSNVNLQGDAYLKHNQYGNAIAHYQRAIDLLEGQERPWNLGYSYLGLSKSYLGSKNLNLALQSNLNGLRQYELIGHKFGLMELYEIRVAIHKQQNNFVEAFNYLSLYQAYKDSIYNEKQSKQINLLKTTYETEKKEREVIELTQRNELQTLELSQQRYILGGSVLFILFLIGSGTLLFRQKQLQQQQSITNFELEETRKRFQVEQQYRDSELKALRSQMNPHFVFNALNSIQEYIMTNERKLAGKYLGKFADLMRTYLYHSQAKEITLNEELDALNLYLELEKLRFEDTLDYSIHVDDKIEAEQISIPSLIIQPYVENAIKHGLLHKKQNRKLTITFASTDRSQVISCEIKDNGIGRKKSAELNASITPEHKSFATQATKSRLELLNYNHDTFMSETIDDLFDEHGEASGTKVLLHISVVPSNF